MPCEEIIQVVGTLIPLESRTLHSNQLAQDEFLRMTQKQQSFRKEPFLLSLIAAWIKHRLHRSHQD
ncbi:hypothetical protein ACTWQL_00790 [Pseudalkalibacillus sp. R45]|uniref:hypothetical protein n=1 Tax=Pseudalkalibacillus sp. R45 TaxID=3457433 RepID=UPI003FCD1F43